MDCTVFKLFAKVFPAFLHYLLELVNERLKSMKVFQQTMNFACNHSKVLPYMVYHIRGTFGGDFNLAVWRF